MVDSIVIPIGYSIAMVYPVIHIDQYRIKSGLSPLSRRNDSPDKQPFPILKIKNVFNSWVEKKNLDDFLVKYDLLQIINLIITVVSCIL